MKTLRFAVALTGALALSTTGFAGNDEGIHADEAPAFGPMHDLGTLPAGQVVTGPALIEDVDTVIAVNPGWTYRVGDDLSGTLGRVR